MITHTLPQASDPTIRLYVLHDLNTGEESGHMEMNQAQADWRNRILRREHDDRRWIPYKDSNGEYNHANISHATCYN